MIDRTSLHPRRPTEPLRRVRFQACPKVAREPSLARKERMRQTDPLSAASIIASEPPRPGALSSLRVLRASVVNLPIRRRNVDFPDVSTCNAPSSPRFNSCDPSRLSTARTASCTATPGLINRDLRKFIGQTKKFFANHEAGNFKPQCQFHQIPLRSFSPSEFVSIRGSPEEADQPYQFHEVYIPSQSEISRRVSSKKPRHFPVLFGTD